MIDMHSHVLPFIDDGADNVETSLEMLEIAKNCGAVTVAATPHCVLRKSGMTAFLNKRKESFEMLKEKMSACPDKYPDIVLGAEILLGEDITEYDGFKQLCYGSSKYILLELSPHVSCSVLSEWIYNVSISGLIPVIAHIDRFPDAKRMMSELNGMEVVYQINASRFFGMFSHFVVKELLNDAVHFVVSSDMHNLTSRSFNMHTAYNKAIRYINRDRCNEMFGGLAEKILSDKLI